LSAQLPPCQSGRTINFEKSDVFCTKECGRPHLKKSLSRLVRTGQTPLDLWTPFTDGPKGTLTLMTIDQLLHTVCTKQVRFDLSVNHLRLRYSNVLAVTFDNASISAILGRNISFIETSNLLLVLNCCSS